MYFKKLQWLLTIGQQTGCLNTEVKMTWSVLSKALKKNQRDIQVNQQLRELVKSVVREVCKGCPGVQRSVYIGPGMRGSFFGEEWVLWELWSQIIGQENCMSIPKFLTLIFPCHSNIYLTLSMGACCFNYTFHFIFLKAKRFMDSLKGYME